MEPDLEKKAREIVDKIKESPFWPDDVETIAQALRQREAETWEKAAAHVDPANSGRRWKADLAQDFRDWARSLRTEGKPGKGGEK